MGNQPRKDNFHRATFKKRRLQSGAVVEESRGYVDGPFLKESDLEQWLADHFENIDPKAVLIGTQIDLGYNLPIDMLGLLPTADFCIIELKRDAADIDDVAQLMHYASLLDQLVRSDLDRLVQNRHKQTLAEFYTAHFKKEYPGKRPRSPRLVLLAGHIPPTVESLLLYLNQKHRFCFQAMSYLSPASEPGEPKLDLVNIMTPGDELAPAGPMPGQLFMIRYRECEHGLWDELRDSRTIPCPTGEGRDRLLAALDQEAVTLLVYLDGCGYAGLVTATKESAGMGKPAAAGDPIRLKATWDVFLPRELALFQSESWQPPGDVVRLQDEELWSSITGRLRYRARKPRRVSKHGAERRPYKGSKPGTG